jgi:AcrR family transcriptional regulator
MSVQGHVRSPTAGSQSCSGASADPQKADYRQRVSDLPVAHRSNWTFAAKATDHIVHTVWLELTSHAIDKSIAYRSFQQLGTPINEETVAAQRLEKPHSASGLSDSKKRRQIMEGARRLFLAQGFDAASMNAIAQDAGVSKGTLYVYFESKEELFEAIVEEQCAEQAQQIFAFETNEDIQVVLGRVGRELVRFLCRPGGVPALRTVIAIADRMPGLGAKFYLAGPARGIASLKAYFEDQVNAGVLKPHDCEIAAAQFIQSCLSLTFWPMLYNFAGPPTEERIQRVVEMAVHTFLATHKALRGTTSEQGQP